jgi:hypothetical protein
MIVYKENLHPIEGMNNWLLLQPLFEVFTLEVYESTLVLRI